MIPNGVLIVDLVTKEAAYANRELERLISEIKGAGLTLKERICSFRKHDREGSAIRAGKYSDSSYTSNSLSKQGINLWDYLFSTKALEPQSESVFKLSSPKRYLEVKIQVINEGT